MGVMTTDIGLRKSTPTISRATMTILCLLTSNPTFLLRVLTPRFHPRHIARRPPPRPHPYVSAYGIPKDPSYRPLRAAGFAVSLPLQPRPSQQTDPVAHVRQHHRLVGGVNPGIHEAVASLRAEQRG